MTYRNYFEYKCYDIDISYTKGEIIFKINRWNAWSEIIKSYENKYDIAAVNKFGIDCMYTFYTICSDSLTKLYNDEQKFNFKTYINAHMLHSPEDSNIKFEEAPVNIIIDMYYKNGSAFQIKLEIPLIEVDVSSNEVKIKKLQDELKACTNEFKKYDQALKECLDRIQVLENNNK
jgi:hypothetical protein